MISKIAASVLGVLACLSAHAAEFNEIPSMWRWTGPCRVSFSYGAASTQKPFTLDVRGFKTVEGDAVSDPAPKAFPSDFSGAVNLTWSPDSSRIAFTRGGDLFVADANTLAETRLTHDGSDLVLNGYASWVYYEEIFGRPSKYRAFWWAPDSRSIAFYRFDNSHVPMFPIYSPFGQDGTLGLTRYPKAGEKNPEVRIGMVSLDSPGKIVWADFDPTEDQYFGTPFWSADSKALMVSREPRIQNTLDLFRVDASNGSKSPIYHETYPTWLNWIEGMLFSEDGLYMVRAFETGWQQIYFLSYDGRIFRRLTDGTNWRMQLIRLDESTGDVFFTAHRDSDVRSALYKVDSEGVVTPLTDPSLNVSGVEFSSDGKFFVCALDNYTTPTQVWVYETSCANLSWKARNTVATSRQKGKRSTDRYARRCFKVCDAAGSEFDLSKYAMPRDVRLKLSCGLTVPGKIVYPKDFDPSKKYPVHVEIYGGPNTAYVRDRWRTPDEKSQWWSDHGIIHLVADVASSGHNGRAGTDRMYLKMDQTEVSDFVEWGRWLQSLPYVIPDKIGVEGFSFGGTMTALLLLDHSDVFHYGIAGGGVYDWALYDTHYTERFMQTPRTNPEGYASTRVIGHVGNYPVGFGKADDGSVMLKLTHGTGDDNVHYQNTLQLIDALQRQGKKFELMVYPDGMHGYRGEQGAHSLGSDRDFWLKYLKGE